VRRHSRPSGSIAYVLGDFIKPEALGDHIKPDAPSDLSKPNVHGSSVIPYAPLHLVKPHAPDDLIKSDAHGDLVKPETLDGSAKLAASQGEPGTSVLPGSTKAVLDKELDRPWVQRLDALKLSAEITKPAFEQGFGWGKFWFKPIALNVYYFTDRNKYYAIKRDLQTNAKVLVSDTYLHKKIDDTPSMILSDLYANFSFLGFVLGGIFMGVILAFIDASLMRSMTVGPVIIGLFLLEKSLYSEKEFITLLIDLVKFAPVPLMAAVLLWDVPLRRYVRNIALFGADAIVK
jgi:hypothetical protein